MLCHITLHLARSRAFPEGSPRYGYEITAPLGDQGYSNEEEWADKRAYCRVRRLRADEGASITIQDNDEKPYTFQMLSVKQAEPAAAKEHR